MRELPNLLPLRISYFFEEVEFKVWEIVYPFDVPGQKLERWKAVGSLRNSRPINCIPIGSPELENPHGTEIPETRQVG